tara:strand:- start:640 stop:753 length:114 start_codon:yes stop_codon:yes gene_type:complete
MIYNTYNKCTYLTDIEGGVVQLARTLDWQARPLQNHP